MRRSIPAGLLLSAALALVALPGDASSITLIASLDPNQGQLPESLTVDDDGDVILSMSVAHTIAKIIPDGAHAPVAIATLPVAAGAFSSGVKVGADGNIYACSAAFDPTLDAAHVWRISRSGAVSEVSHLDATGFPNDLVFDDDGNLYVTDSTLGRIYKIDPWGNTIVWLSDPRLVGNTAAPVFPGTPFGADGIVFDKQKRHLYVDNFDFGEIFRIRVRNDGSPGPLETFASDPRLVGSDGLAFDNKGNLYAAVNAQNQIAVLDDGGDISIVASGAPFDNPSSLAFGPEGRARKTLYISSFAIAKAIGAAPGTPQPSLDSIEVPFRGLPLP